jgi:hypothetical protein
MKHATALGYDHSHFNEQREATNNSHLNISANNLSLLEPIIAQRAENAFYVTTTTATGSTIALVCTLTSHFYYFYSILASEMLLR